MRAPLRLFGGAPDRTHPEIVRTSKILVVRFDVRVLFKSKRDKRPQTGSPGITVTVYQIGQLA